MRGEVVKAEIVLKNGHCPDDKEIIRYCKIYLSNYKVPREVIELANAGKDECG
jgi:acyl-coenzyme A synthetase/AMP-(fatty) acid ligase